MKILKSKKDLEIVEQEEMLSLLKSLVLKKDLLTMEIKYYQI